MWKHLLGKPKKTKSSALSTSSQLISSQPIPGDILVKIKRSIEKLSSAKEDNFSVLISSILPPCKDFTVIIENQEEFFNLFITANYKNLCEKFRVLPLLLSEQEYSTVELGINKFHLYLSKELSYDEMCSKLNVTELHLSRADYESVFSRPDSHAANKQLDKLIHLLIILSGYFYSQFMSKGDREKVSSYKEYRGILCAIQSNEKFINSLAVRDLPKIVSALKDSAVQHLGYLIVSLLIKNELLPKNLNIVNGVLGEPLTAHTHLVLREILFGYFFSSLDQFIEKQIKNSPYEITPELANKLAGFKTDKKFYPDYINLFLYQILIWMQIELGEENYLEVKEQLNNFLNDILQNPDYLALINIFSNFAKLKTEVGSSILPVPLEVAAHHRDTQYRLLKKESVDNKVIKLYETFLDKSYITINAKYATTQNQFIPIGLTGNEKKNIDILANFLRNIYENLNKFLMNKTSLLRQEIETLTYSSLSLQKELAELKQHTSDLNDCVISEQIRIIQSNIEELYEKVNRREFVAAPTKKFLKNAILLNSMDENDRHKNNQCFIKGTSEHEENLLGTILSILELLRSELTKYSSKDPYSSEIIDILSIFISKFNELKFNLTQKKQPRQKPAAKVTKPTMRTDIPLGKLGDEVARVARKKDSGVAEKTASEKRQQSAPARTPGFWKDSKESEQAEFDNTVPLKVIKSDSPIPTPRSIFNAQYEKRPNSVSHEISAQGSGLSFVEIEKSPVVRIREKSQRKFRTSVTKSTSFDKPLKVDGSNNNVDGYSSDYSRRSRVKN